MYSSAYKCFKKHVSKVLFRAWHFDNHTFSWSNKVVSMQSHFNMDPLCQRQPCAHHMTRSCDDSLLHGLFHYLFLSPHIKTSVNFLYWCAVIWLCYTIIRLVLSLLFISNNSIITCNMSISNAPLNQRY